MDIRQFFKKPTHGTNNDIRPSCASGDSGEAGGDGIAVANPSSQTATGSTSVSKQEQCIDEVKSAKVVPMSKSSSAENNEETTSDMSAELCEVEVASDESDGEGEVQVRELRDARKRSVGSEQQVPIVADLGNERPAQPTLRSYPETLAGKKRTRKFLKSWYSGRPWLEYSVQADACFCYACRNFGIRGTKEQDTSFITIGFSKWKIAMESNRGFRSHEQSKMHIDAMAQWSEFECRKKSGSTIELQLSRDQLARNRYYVKSVAEVIVFLAVNELALRGDHEQAQAEESRDSLQNVGGLFLRLFDFALQKDEKLRSISHSMPKNAKYTSPDVQNEVIDVLREMVQDIIVEEYKKSDIGQFCLKCDETRDANNVEDMSVVIRFVKDGKPVEHLLSMVRLEAVDAKAITKAILDELQQRDIDCRAILSQCFDGASVMSGCRGGVQTLLQEEIGKKIPYVHCFNHQIHLVVVHCMQRETKAKKFFGMCEQLYIFFRRQFPANIYQGKTLKRLLEQRWTGHFESSKVVCDNRDEILATLEAVSESDAVNADMNVEAAGLHAYISKAEFACVATMVVRILSILQPANAMMQGKACNMSAAMDLITSSIASVKELRNKETFTEIAEAAGCSKAADPGQTHLKRKRRESTMLRGSFVLSTTGQEGVEGDPRDRLESTEWQQLRQTFFAIIDNVAGEMQNRFGELQSGLSGAISALLPSSKTYLHADQLLPLTTLLQQDKNEDIGNALRGELTVAVKFMREKLQPDCDLQDAAICLTTYKDAFPILNWHYAAALTIGISTASCENSFSCLTRVLRPYRRSMTHARKNSLVVLAFEKAITKSLNMDVFLDKFSRKSRRISL